METYFKLIYCDRWDTQNPHFHSYYDGSLNTWRDSEYAYLTMEDLIYTVGELIREYGADNVTLDYIPWNQNFRVLIAA